MSNPANLQPDSLIKAEKCKEYWESVDSDNNGMLGGVLSDMPSVSRVDLQGSRTFLARLGIGIKSGRQKVPRVLEGGAGLQIRLMSLSPWPNSQRRYAANPA
ncbi:hypothetical protein LB505_001975 [Fusarium chuoi]|nr:hypothetical protein LB505_001975 [Fusarium chuoi]